MKNLINLGISSLVTAIIMGGLFLALGCEFKEIWFTLI